MKSYAVLLCLGACLAADAASEAAPRGGVIPGGAFGRGLPPAARLTERHSPTGGVARAFGQDRRRPRLPVFSPVISTGGLDDSGVGVPVFDGVQTGSLDDSSGSVGVIVTSRVADGPAAPPIEDTGPGTAVAHPGPRIIYVSNVQPRRRHARLPTVIYGISLAGAEPTAQRRTAR